MYLRVKLGVQMDHLLVMVAAVQVIAHKPIAFHSEPFGGGRVEE